MTRFVVDTSAVLHLASTAFEVPDKHELLAPTLLRSQTLSALHEAVHRGELPAGVGRGRWRISWDRPRRTTPSTLHSLSCRQTHSSLWTRNWRAASKGSSRPR